MSAAIALQAMQGTAVTAGLASAAVVDVGIAGMAITAGRVVIRSVIRSIRRVLRTVHAVITITRRHVPKWVAVALGAALWIPGPFDEIAMLAVIGWYAWKRPAMRAELRAGIPAAWKGE